jgi:hypothetical protein
MTHVFALLLYLYAITYHPYGGGGEDKEARGIQRRKHCLIVCTKHWLSLKYAQKPIFRMKIHRIKPDSSVYLVFWPLLCHNKET